jgi:mannose-6-phosphate isomerase
MQPILLPANQPRSFYRGAGRIAAFRGAAPPADPYHLEDWIASTTARFGQTLAGLTVRFCCVGGRAVGSLKLGARGLRCQG